MSRSSLHRQCQRQHVPHVLLLLVLCCIGLALGAPSLGSIWPVADRSAPQLVSSPAQFVAALGDHDVRTILLGQDLIMSEETWPEAVVRVGRNLTIDGQQHFINFTRVRDKVSLDAGVHLSLRNLDFTGVSAASFMAFIADSPDAFVWMRDGAFKCHHCPPPKKWAVMIAALPRPSGFPGKQVVTRNRLPTCVLNRCYKLAMLCHDFAADIYPLTYGNTALRAKYTALKMNLTWACGTVMSDTCGVMKGFDKCRAELLERHEQGLLHAYDRRTYESFLRCAVAVAVVVLTALLLLIVRLWRSWRERGYKTFTLPDWPLQTDSSRSVFSSMSGDLPEAIKLESILGCGSFGSVYLGTWRDTRVAVKVVLHDAKNAAKVAREASIGLRMEHPNVVRTLHQFTVPLKVADLQQILPGRLASHPLIAHTPTGQSTELSESSEPQSSQQHSTWILQEVCDIGTLTDHLKHLRSLSPTGDVETAVIVGNALDIAQGMAYLHDNGVCHGDLKARNVLVATDASSARGEVAKVADFGVSQYLDKDRSHLSTTSLGTISHMPPELLETGKLTRECDVYSFGVMLCEILTGQLLYHELNVAQVIHKVTSGERPDFPPHVPPELIALARDCWAHDPAVRPAFVAIAERLKGMMVPPSPPSSAAPS